MQLVRLSADRFKGRFFSHLRHSCGINASGPPSSCRSSRCPIQEAGAASSPNRRCLNCSEHLFAINQLQPVPVWRPRPGCVFLTEECCLVLGSPPGITNIQPGNKQPVRRRTRASRDAASDYFRGGINVQLQLFSLQRVKSSTLKLLHGLKS